ncbi:inositol monophosphatase family protein [Lentzea atacamensis]|uniref:Inositol monophosphatase family protein n=1 Tax=Lentzea atacamensis TaxID=531938 RepID=A0A316IPW8_9PSEU|nr:inositol monophosphatase family protein [Lentzea atacamensis]
MDGHFELDLRMWDVVAAGLVIEEAGGVVSGWTGEDLSWTSPEDKLDVVASYGLVHEALLRAVGGSG